MNIPQGETNFSLNKTFNYCVPSVKELINGPETRNLPV